MRNVVVAAAFLLMSVVTLLQLPTADAASEPVCTYRNSEDETIFLKYMPLLKRGEDYVDWGKEGRCLKRASCTDTFKTHVETCGQFTPGITCENKDRFTGVFPGCCLRCKS